MSAESSISRFLRPAQAGAGTAAKLLAGTQRMTEPRVVTVDVMVKVAVL
jgi:1-aminocyclopropane-1-carboxylate deaminase/D-cysteine desulfhydrase-like pyridoxal-dependent ACC family enzyme